jgi:hypothetical protein
MISNVLHCNAAVSEHRHVECTTRPQLSSLALSAVTCHNTIKPTLNHPHPLLTMARDHPKNASSSSKNESNNNESLSTMKSDTLLSRSDKCAIRITRFIRFAGKMNGESWYGREYMARKNLAEAKDSDVREFYKAVEKNASSILVSCFPSEGQVMRERIREMFGKSPQSEIYKLRREYEEKVTAPMKESIETFSFHEKTNYLNMEIFRKVRFALICFVSCLRYFILLSLMSSLRIATETRGTQAYWQN